MAKIKKDYLVTKRNVLNELRSNAMTLQELRFFSIYLSKINPKDISTRTVRFPLEDFRVIMELDRIKIDYLKNVTNSLLSKVVNVPTERGGYEAFQLFKKCKIDLDEYNEWYIEINAHDDALPLMFEFKDRYFSYELWNALRLKSSNQLRMYELLKQYEKIGCRIFSVEDLKQDLGLEKNEYQRFNNFKQWVLDPCQQSLQENTDISFTYEPYGKRGQGGKVVFLKFTITKNQNYVDQLSLNEFIENQKQENLLEEEPKESRLYEKVSFISEACKNEFSEKEMMVIYLTIMDKFPYQYTKDDIWFYDYLHKKYQELNMMDERNPITHRFSYLKKIIEAEDV